MLSLCFNSVHRLLPVSPFRIKDGEVSGSIRKAMTTVPFILN